MNAIPLSLYVHFPWCVKKCPYCDFNSHALQGDLPAAAYTDALLNDFNSEVEKEHRKQLTSVFLGGGTPSLFPPDEIKRLLVRVAEVFDIKDAEITMEANPGALDVANFEGYLDAGINRLSIGAQSFSNEALLALGRVHEADEIIRAFEGARKSGFERINLDLMYGLPGQTMDGSKRDLLQAISLGADHISWYQLTIEPNTYFHRYPPIRPGEHQIEDIMKQGFALLSDQGYERYEISAFAKRGEKSRHNLNYWLFGDYLGIGAGAHGKITRQDKIVRTAKTRAPSDYLKHQMPIETVVPQEEILIEYLMNTLRLTDGFQIPAFCQRTGLERTVLASFLKAGIERELLICAGDEVKPSEKGQLFLNDLLLLAA